jgi:hypothetical protein
VSVGTVTQKRAAAADRASTRIEAEAGTLSGGATVVAGRWATYVGGIGNGGTLTVPRPAGRPGPHQLTVWYAQADKNTGHPYNTDAITRFADVTEQGSTAPPTRLSFRHNYTWDGFWPESYRIDLTTADGALTLGNATAWGPNIDAVQVSPLILDTTVRPRR